MDQCDGWRSEGCGRWRVGRKDGSRKSLEGSAAVSVAVVCVMGDCQVQGMVTLGVGVQRRNR